MLLSPAILALILVSVTVSLMLLLASGFAIQIITLWDINSGSEQQLVLERRTYLISTLLTWAFVAELVSLLLFVYNAESMSGQFVGAMCATGVLNVNVWGWPTLFLKMIVFFSGAAWLTLNYLDNQGYDYPLVKLKYSLLLLIVPLVIAEFVVQLLHFQEMEPDVIVSCCGSLFSSESESVAAGVAGIQPRIAMLAFYVSGLAMLLSGVWFLRRKSGGILFAVMGVAVFVISMIAIVSFVSPYIYEHPHHHCPFCILKSGHDFAGYFLYIPLFVAAVLALGVGVISPWAKVPSLAASVVKDAPRLAWLSMALFAMVYAMSTWMVLSSSLTMQGVWW
ncbi:MAG: hypothetical protein OQL16_13520 [Gammaproteobacteria bacterium]|nr:hypothetical protein [Gammaproteobacteria bacterium]